MNIIGIDVSKNKLDCAWIDSTTPEKLKFKVVSNSEDGFVILIDWLNQHTRASMSEYHFVMEATGVYHEKFAYWLHGCGAKISVISPA